VTRSSASAEIQSSSPGEAMLANSTAANTAARMSAMSMVSAVMRSPMLASVNWIGMPSGVTISRRRLPSPLRSR